MNLASVGSGSLPAYEQGQACHKPCANTLMWRMPQGMGALAVRLCAPTIPRSQGQHSVSLFRRESMSLSIRAAGHAGRGQLGAHARQDGALALRGHGEASEL